MSFLRELIFGCPVTVMNGKGYVEVKLSGVSKGKAVELFLKKISEKTNNNPPIDFILCIGDDRWVKIEHFIKKNSSVDIIMFENDHLSPYCLSSVFFDLYSLIGRMRKCSPL